MRNAMLDFEDHLKMLPEASDADDIRAVILAIRRTLASGTRIALLRVVVRC